MKRVKNFKRREKVEREIPAAHGARLFRLHPEPGRPFVVELRMSPTRRRMRDEMQRLEGRACAERDRCVMGLVRSWSNKITGRPAVRPRGVVARIYLNVVDVRRRPSEIVSHECTHAGMAWARFQRANLAQMPGEEVLAHAVGRLVKQVIRVCYAMGVFR